MSFNPAKIPNNTFILNVDTLTPKLFTNVLGVIQAHTFDEIPSAFDKIIKILQKGFYLAGFFSYECGYFFEPSLHTLNSKPLSIPLLYFAVFEKPMHYDIPAHLENYKISDITFHPDYETYQSAIDKIKKYILSGDVYQINFTGRLYFNFEGWAYSLFTNIAKKHPVPYSAFVKLNESEYILSFSPELFFAVKKQNIVCKPMKGTMPRGKDPKEDIQLATFLQNDAKNRAENLMIVDLIRNDFGRVCEIGSIKVERLFEVERYNSLFQMTSTVVGHLRKDTSIYDILKAIFPGGSITGAPKIRAMQIIYELEDTPRGIYTGSIGYMSPDGDYVFNIAIRTIYLKGTNAVMGIGSGIVWDSNSAQEYDECLLKAEFLRRYA